VSKWKCRNKVVKTRSGPRCLTAPGAIPEDFPDRSPAGKFDDEDYPAYSMGHAAEILGVTAAFLRSLDAAKLLTPAAPRAVTVATPATSSDLPPAPAN
jgi:hypothetical protein